MPELPEVEITRRQIEKFLPLKILEIIESQFSSSILKENLFDPKFKTVLAINRLGKYLIFELCQKGFIVSHMGMSGSWQLSKSKIELKHTHIQFKCSKNGDVLYLGYIDPRRFGNIYFTYTRNIIEKFKNLGPDVSGKKFSLKYLDSILKKYPKKSIKSLLMNQKYFAGIGNYMASEICFESKILPLRIASRINKQDALRIIKATQFVIERSLKLNGMTMQDFKNLNGQRGSAFDALSVFKKDRCKICNNKVIKIFIEKRGTYYCSYCQR